MKTLILIAFAGVALAQSPKAATPEAVAALKRQSAEIDANSKAISDVLKNRTPEVPRLELTEMKLTATTAQNVVLRLEMLKAQYNELLREKERLSVELETKFTAVFTKAGARREDWDLDPDKGVFVRKEAAKK